LDSDDDEAADGDEEVIADLGNDASGILQGKRLQYVKDQISMLTKKDIYSSPNVRGMWIKHDAPPLSINPDDSVKPDIFLWRSEQLKFQNCAITTSLDFNMPCPGCKINNADTVSHGETSTVARRVVDLDRCYFVYTTRWRCKDCKTSFTASSHEVISLMPPEIQSLFPAFLTHRSGLDFELASILGLQRRVSVSFPR
jgi:hypothetical protein